MKKIHVVRKDEESIEGYEKVEINPEDLVEYRINGYGASIY